MWECQRCGTHSEDSLDACWKCGTNIDGRFEPDFRHADNYLPRVPEAKHQYRLMDMFWATTAIALTLAGLNTENPILFVAGSATLALMLFCSAVPN